MQNRSFPFWLMIVSSSTVVLPVKRSPMISSRWPRPIGFMVSIALVKVAVLAEDDRTNLVLLEVQRKPICVVRELEQLSGHRVPQAIDLGDAVTDGDDAADVRRDQAGVEILQALLDDLRDLAGAD